MSFCLFKGDPSSVEDLVLGRIDTDNRILLVDCNDFRRFREIADEMIVFGDDSSKSLSEAAFRAQIALEEDPETRILVAGVDTAIERFSVKKVMSFLNTVNTFGDPEIIAVTREKLPGGIADTILPLCKSIVSE